MSSNNQPSPRVTPLKIILRVPSSSLDDASLREAHAVGELHVRRRQPNERRWVDSGPWQDSGPDSRDGLHIGLERAFTTGLGEVAEYARQHGYGGLLVFDGEDDPRFSLRDEADAPVAARASS